MMPCPVKKVTVSSYTEQMMILTIYNLYISKKKIKPEYSPSTVKKMYKPVSILFFCNYSYNIEILNIFLFLRDHL